MAGGTRVISIYAQQLKRRGHIVRVISPPHPSVPLRRKLKAKLLGRDIPEGPREISSHFDQVEMEHHVLERFRPVREEDVPDSDVVIATWWETAEWVNSLSPKKGAKVYFIQHHEIFEHLPVARCEATYRLPMHKIVVARWLQTVMRDRYSDYRVDVVPNSVDHAQFFAGVRRKQNVPTIGVLYGSVSFKGLDVSLDAIRAVQKRISNTRIISFGSERVKASLPLPPGAEFTFKPDQNDLRQLYSRCDVWVTASRSEGFNLPAMEAMACRTPVVSTRAGWPEEAIKTNYNGVLVDVDDSVGLANGVEWVLMRDESEWTTLSTNAFNTVIGSSWEASADMFETALFRACERAARGEIAGGLFTNGLPPCPRRTV